MSWRSSELGCHIDILSGFAFKSERFNSDRRGLPLVRIRDVLPGESDTFYEGPYEERYVVSDGDLLVGMDGEFNRARWRGGRGLLNQRVCKLTAANGSLDEGYLFHVLPQVLKEIEDKTPFVTVKHLSAKDLRQAEIPLPPFDEQKRIAAILDQADELRRLRQRAIDRLNELGQAIFYEMFVQHESHSWPVMRVADVRFKRARDHLAVNSFTRNLSNPASPSSASIMR
jgi:type I restriction enzyme S subunit